MGARHGGDGPTPTKWEAWGPAVAGCGGWERGAVCETRDGATQAGVSTSAGAGRGKGGQQSAGWAARNRDGDRVGWWPWQRRARTEASDHPRLVRWPPVLASARRFGAELECLTPSLAAGWGPSRRNGNMISLAGH